MEFRVVVKPEELRTHFAARAEHHLMRAEVFDKQVAEVGHDRPPTNPYENGVDPVAGIKENARRHHAQHSKFKFLLDHVAPEPQRLSLGDLEALELVKRSAQW